MLAWFGELNAKERRTMGACFGGWALDAFDVQMYSFVIPTVIALWGLSRGEAGLIGTVTLLISSLGGWFSGTLADRFGRVRMLQITILWYSIFTFLCAFAQNFEQLFVLRALHGLGFGGEWAAGAVLMGEVIRDKYRGRGVGIVQTGWAVGWGVSALAYTALYAFLARGDRLARAVRDRALAGGFVFWIRRHIDEPEIFRDSAARSPGGRRRPSVRRVPRAAFVDHGQGPADGRRRAGRRLCARDLDADLSAHRARLVGDQHRRVSTGADPRRALGFLIGLLSERRDRPQIDLHALGDRLVRDDPRSTCSCRWTTRRSSSLVIPLFTVFLMKFPPMGPFMTELYPTAVRGTAQGSATMAAGRSARSSRPWSGFVSQSLPLGATIALFSAFASGLMIVMLLALPETRGRSLESLDAVTPASPGAAVAGGQPGGN